MTSLDILKDSFSIVGTKHLGFQSDPKKLIRFSDTGGIFGEPFETTLSFNSFCAKSSLLVSRPHEKAIGHIKFAADKEVLFSCPQTVLSRLVTLSDTSHFPAIWFPAKVSDAELNAFKQRGGTEETADGFWDQLDFTTLSFLPVRLEIRKDRLELYALDYPASEIPISGVSLSLDGANLRCNNRLLIGDNQLDGFTMEFPTSEMATRWVELIGLKALLGKREQVAQNRGGDLVGLIGRVSVEGIWQGDRLERSVGDAQIDGSSVRILKQTGTEHFSFDFKSPTLAVDGKAAEFVVSPDSSSAIQITSESKPFLRAIYTNDAVNGAVVRSSNVGPFIARDLEGRFVRIEAMNNKAAISYDGSRPIDIPAGLTRPILKITDSQGVLHVGDRGLNAELPTLEGICAVLTGISLQPVACKDFQNAIAQLLALEGKFLTHCVFGKLAVVHITLMNELKCDVQSSCSLLRRDEDKQMFLGVLAETTRELSLECETVMNYLPSYILEQDRNFLCSAGLPSSLDYAVAESGYQAAVSPIGAFLSHFGRIEGYTSQFQSSKNFAARKEGWAAYAPLGASVAAGLFVNPLLLIGAFQQVSALKRGKDAKESVGAEAIQTSYAACAREWDFIVRTLLPAISNRFVKQIYPLRLAVAHALRKAYETGDENVKNTLHRVVAQRLGRLTAFLDFPMSSDLGVKRNDYVDFVWGKQSHAEGIHEKPF